MTLHIARNEEDEQLGYAPLESDAAKGAEEMSHLGQALLESDTAEGVGEVLVGLNRGAWNRSVSCGSERGGTARGISVGGWGGENGNSRG